MALFDEDEEAGLEDELQDETVDETADEEAPSGPLDSLASIAELRNQLSSASSEAKKNRKVLEKIQAARLKLLEAPSRKEALMGLAQKLVILAFMSDRTCIPSCATLASTVRNKSKLRKSGWLRSLPLKRWGLSTVSLRRKRLKNLLCVA